MYKDLEYIKTILKKNMTSANLTTIYSIIKNMAENNESFINYHDSFSKCFTLFLNEDISLSELFEPLDTPKENIIEMYENGEKKFKTKKLIELYNIKVFYGNSKFISYKDKNNIESEIIRILDNYTNLKTYLNSFIPSGDFKYSEEFLNINGVLPKMITSNRIRNYSSLLNNDKLNTNLKTFLNLDNSVTDNQWNTLSGEFTNFLEDLISRTINYK